MTKYRLANAKQELSLVANTIQNQPWSSTPKNASRSAPIAVEEIPRSDISVTPSGSKAASAQKGSPVHEAKPVPVLREGERVVFIRVLGDFVLFKNRIRLRD